MCVCTNAEGFSDEPHLTLCCQNAKFPDTPLLPTVQVDLVWHAHMANPVAYRNDCKR